MPIHLVLADPYPLILDGLELLCSKNDDFVPMASCLDGAEALGAVRQHTPDILILDFPLSTCDGLSVLRTIRQENLPTRAIILTTALENAQAVEIMRLGVRGVVLKTMPTHLLAQCIRKVHTGGQWLEKQSMGSAFEKMLQSEAGARRIATILTPREIEILCLVAGGLSNGQIGDRLLLKEGTVKIHLHNIYKKLGVKNRVDLTLYAQKKGLV